ncbi:MAG: CapA family protein [Methylobacter sp.]
MKKSHSGQTVTLFLCGDVMTGRAIDQILPYPGQPRLFEPYMTSAKDYLRLAEQANGPLPGPVGLDYIWGDALAELDRVAPNARIINLETAVTASAEFWLGKVVHYKMQPRNIGCITAAGIDCCVLANNHVLDWGYSGLDETLATLSDAKLKTAGAGRNRDEAEAPAIIDMPGKGRALVFACGDESSGIPWSWGARNNRPGVSLLPDLSEQTVHRMAERIAACKQDNDLVVVSIHWGGNWGYEIFGAQREFAHRLIDLAQVDVVHGHSSHHAKGIEVYRGKPVLYGCGDFLNDYEGISGHEEYRGDLALMYFVTLDSESLELVGLTMTPMCIERFRLRYADAHDVRWLRQIMDRECGLFGSRVELADERRLKLTVAR